MRRQGRAYGDNPIYRNMLDVGGDYAFRLRGEDHAWTPDSVSRLQHAVRGNNPAEYDLFANRSTTERAAADDPRPDAVQGWRGVPLDEVEAANEIVKRFSTGAMSFGSISARRTPRWPSP